MVQKLTWGRRNLNPMFSESAMRAQEPILKGYIDLLIQRLHEICSEPVDIVAWLNYTTFDIIGDLTFGESFDCLKTSKLHVCDNHNCRSHMGANLLSFG